MKELYEKYRVKKKGLKTVIEELKQRMLAKSAKVKRYEQRIEQFRQNRIFDLDQKKIYRELNGNGIKSNGVPNAEEYTKFWGNIWGVRKEHNREAEWLKDLKRERVNERPQERVSISLRKQGNNAERYQIGKPQGETKSKDIGSRTSAVYTNVFPHK